MLIVSKNCNIFIFLTGNGVFYCNAHKLRIVEIKKSNSANLEGKCAEHFLLGLIVVLACLFTAFEYNNIPSMDDDSSTMDELSQDVALMPSEDTKNMMAAESSAPAPASSNSMTDKLKAVDRTEPKDVSSNVNVSTNPLVVGDGQGVAKDGQGAASNANVTTAIQQTPPQDPNDDSPVKLSVVEQLPEFPGGMTELMKWLTKNLKYPPMAQRQKIQGKVVVSFIINRDGSIASPRLEVSVDPYLDKEAMRVVRMMPNWTPGMEHDKPCRTMFAIPIVFQL